VIAIGIADELILQAPRTEQLEAYDLTATGIARRTTEALRTALVR